MSVPLNFSLKLCVARQDWLRLSHDQYFISPHILAGRLPHFGQLFGHLCRRHALSRRHAAQVQEGPLQNEQQSRGADCPGVHLRFAPLDASECGVAPGVSVPSGGNRDSPACRHGKERGREREIATSRGRGLVVGGGNMFVLCVSRFTEIVVCAFLVPGPLFSCCTSLASTEF